MGDDRTAEYYQRRQRQERALAEAAPSPNVRKIHATLARNYARLAENDDTAAQRSRLHIVTE